MQTKKNLFKHKILNIFRLPRIRNVEAIFHVIFISKSFEIKMNILLPNMCEEYFRFIITQFISILVIFKLQMSDFYLFRVIAKNNNVKMWKTEFTQITQRSLNSKCIKLLIFNTDQISFQLKKCL